MPWWVSSGWGDWAIAVSTSTLTTMTREHTPNLSYQPVYVRVWCVYRPLLAVPLTHCYPSSNDYDKQCYGGSLRSDIECQVFPEGSGPLDLNFRNQVYFGQFRFISELTFSTVTNLYHSPTLLPPFLPSTLSPPLPPLPSFPHISSILRHSWCSVCSLWGN